MVRLNSSTAASAAADPRRHMKRFWRRWYLLYLWGCLPVLVGTPVGYLIEDVWAGMFCMLCLMLQVPWCFFWRVFWRSLRRMDAPSRPVASDGDWVC